VSSGKSNVRRGVSLTTASYFIVNHATQAQARFLTVGARAHYLQTLRYASEMMRVRPLAANLARECAAAFELRKVTRRRE
jgi:hypothetical protein